MCIQVQEQTKIPAYYYNNLTGDYSFICVWSKSKMAIFLNRTSTDPTKTYKTVAEVFLPLILQMANKSSPGLRDVPSSIPIWKNYFPFLAIPIGQPKFFFLEQCRIGNHLRIFRIKK